MLSPARRLILLYALITASTFPYAAVADDVSINKDGLLAGLIISVLIIWGLWKGSSLAWGVAVFLDVLTILGPILMGSTGLTPYVLLALAFAHLAILFSPPVRAHVRAERDTRLAPN
jgi:hypothetical protein